MRYWEALENMVNGVADADGKKGEAFDKKVSLKAGVPCKKFIPAVSAENGFDSTGCEASEKPAGYERGIAERLIESLINFW
jgi:hypothetical protein